MVPRRQGAGGGMNGPGGQAAGGAAAAPPASALSPPASVAPVHSVASAAPRWRLWREVRVLTLVAADLAALVLSASLAYLAWALPVHGQPPAMYLRLLPMALLFAFAYAQAGLYPGFGLGPVERARRFGYATVSTFVVLSSLGFVLKLPHLYSRVAFVLALALSLLVVPVARSGVLAWARRWSWWGEPVVVLAAAGEIPALVGRLQASPNLGYRVVAAVATEGPAPEVPGLLVAGDLTATYELASQGIRVVLLADPPSPAVVDLLQRHFRHVLVLQPSQMPVEGVRIRDLGGVAGVEFTSHLLQRRNQLAKRALDVVLGALLLALAAPVIAVLAVLVKAASPGPAFFVQWRAGRGGHPIAVPKLRTMRHTAEAELRERLEAEPELRREWLGRLKLTNDPRLIPGLGKLLRRFSLDELPQLWSVVIGRMSLVGPRPFPDYHLALLPPDFREFRQRVRPGITGLWQITVRSAGGLDAQERLDTYYIRNWSLWLDLYVLARTVGAVVSGRGAY